MKSDEAVIEKKIYWTIKACKLRFTNIYRVKVYDKNTN